MTDRLDAAPQALEAEVIDPLLGVMESIEGLDPLPQAEAPVPATDGLDDLFDEIAALAPSQPQRHAPSGDGLDSLLGEIAAVSADPPQPVPSAAEDGFDLDGLLDEMAPADPLIGDFDDAPSAEPEVIPVAEPDPAVPPPPAARRARIKIRMPALPGGKRLGLALAGMAAMGVSHGLAFAFGAWSASAPAAPEAHHAASEQEPHGSAGEAAASPAPAPAAEHGGGENAPHSGELGVQRFVGLTGQARIEGRTIFAESEVRGAIEQLEGGLSVLAELDAAEPFLTFTAPIVQHGDWIEVHACNSQDCTRDALALRFNTIEGQAVLCRTRPYVSGARMFYAYGPAGMKEVPGCPGTVKEPIPRSPGSASPA